MKKKKEETKKPRTPSALSGRLPGRDLLLEVGSPALSASRVTPVSLIIDWPPVSGTSHYGSPLYRKG